MLFRSAVAGAMALSVALAAPGAAQAAVLDFNLFVLNDMTVMYGDVEGKAAVGGTATLTGFSIGNSLPSAAVTSFVVGGNLDANGGSAKGTTEVGGTVDVTGSNGTFTTTISSTVSVDFAAAASYLNTRSTQLAGFAVNGNVGTPHANQFLLSGAAAGLNVFTISGAALATSNTFTINLNPGQTALINVTGVSAAFSGGLVINGGSASDVLWNFAQAENLTIQNINMLGSVLAPKATFTGSGQMHGTLIVESLIGNSWGGTIEVHNDGLYTGGLLTPPPPPMMPIPEPGTWAMMIMGIGAVGGAMRRRRAAPALA